MERERKRTWFIAIDGEAIQTATGAAYVLMGASTGETLQTGHALSTDDALAWLVALYQRYAPCQLVWYYGDYDLNNFLRNLEWSAIKELYSGNHVDYRAESGVVYCLRYVPGRCLEIGIRTGDRLRPWFRIDDVRGWTDGGLVKSCEAWGVELNRGDLDRVKQWKAARGKFTADDLPELATYCVTECRLLAEMMQRVEEALIVHQLRPAQWHGPGRAASDLLRRHGVAAHLSPAQTLIENLWLAGYYGGRIQALEIGLIGNAYQYDLNSAYPWALSVLPTMRGRWQRRRVYNPSLPWAIWRVRWDISDGAPLPPFPFRASQGQIYWPSTGEGWYWSPEVAIAHELYADDLTVLDGWEFVPGDDSKPFAWVADYYAYRKRVNGRAPARALATKKVLQALYGKLVQGASYGRDKPQFQSYFWGGLATSLVRARLMEAASINPRAVALMQTDCLITTEPLPLDLGASLGQWRDVSSGDTMVLSSGVFEMRGYGVKRSKARGIAHQAASLVDWSVIRDLWKQQGFDLDYRVSIRRFFGMGAALQTPALWRHWKTFEARISSAPTRAYPMPSGAHRWRLFPIPIERMADSDLSRSYRARGGSLIEPSAVDTIADQVWEREQPGPLIAVE